MAIFRAFQTFTKTFIPWQAPKALPMLGAPAPRKDLWAVLFAHFERNLENYRGFFEREPRMGYLRHCSGDSNRPTLTGVREYIYYSAKFAGGRGINRGDLVSIWGDVDRLRHKDDTRNLCKRIVGLPGDHFWVHKDGERTRRWDTV